MVDNETYYVTAQEQKKVIGPVTPTQITAALKQGKLKPNHLVSHAQEGPWQTLQEVFASASNQSPSLDKQKKPTKQSQATLKKESKSKSHNQQKPEKEWYTVKDLEPVMRKSGSTIRSKFIVPGKIEAQLIGGRYRIAAKEFRRIEDSVSENPKRPQSQRRKKTLNLSPLPTTSSEARRGPLERAAILQAAKGRKLMTGDQIANSKQLLNSSTYFSSPFLAFASP